MREAECKRQEHVAKDGGGDVTLNNYNFLTKEKPMKAFQRHGSHTWPVQADHPNHLRPETLIPNCVFPGDSDLLDLA